MKDQFSEDEWHIVATVPSMIGAAMAGAGKSGILGTAKEAMASMKAMVAGNNEFPDNQVIAGILEKADSFSDAKDKAGAFREKTMAEMAARDVKSPEQFNAYMLDNCAKAIALVTEKCGAEEAGQYRQWSMTIAEKVAQAASEGGFMGFGGEQVSEGEKALLAQIETAFNAFA